MTDKSILEQEFQYFLDVVYGDDKDKINENQIVTMRDCFFAGAHVGSTHTAAVMQQEVREHIERRVQEHKNKTMMN
jgi:hypothetical protein